jgi:aconitate hydratase
MSNHFPQALTELKAERDIPSLGDAEIKIKDEAIKLGDGAVVIAAITSCTNTSNPSVMIAAGLLAKKANALGLTPKLG